MMFRPPLVILAILAAAFFTGCDKISSESSDTSARSVATDSTAALAASGTQTSAHFARVMDRVDVGGKMLHFEDHMGRRELFVNALDAVIESIPAIGGQATINVEEIVDASGLTQAAASGRSVVKDGDSWLMRGYTYYPDGPSGLTEMLGKEAVPFKSPALIPAATDLVVETRLDLSCLPALTERIARACGLEEAMQEALAEPVPPAGDLRSILAAADLHIILGVDVSSWSEKPMLPKPVDYFLQIEGGNELLRKMLPEIEAAMGPPVAMGDRQGWEVPLPAIGMNTKGVVAFDEAGTIVVASRGEYLKFVDTAEMKLGEWKEYQAATDHFPTSGNFLAYTSPQVPAVLGWAIRQAANGSEEQGADLLAKATDYLEPRSLAFCVAREADGMVLTSEMPFAAEMNIGSTLPVLTATSTVFVGARAWKRGSDRAACILNVRNVQQAIRSYQKMNDIQIGAPIPWNEIFGEGHFLEKRPICTGADRYTYAETFPAVGKLACECSHAEHAVPNHADW